MADFIRADFSDLERVGNRFQAVRMELANLGWKVADDIGRIAADAVREEAPLGRTGALKRTIHHVVAIVARLGGGFSVNVVSPQKYTGWVIEGRGVVRPVRARCLHWISKSGEDVFAMRAGPTEPDPFHERGWRRAEPLIRDRWTEYAWSIGARLAD